MSAMLLSSTARVERLRRVWLDLLLGPVSILVVVMSSVLVPVPSYAQVNMTLGQLMPTLIRNTSQVVTATSSGLQVAEAGSVAIGRGSSVLGTVAINELRSIPLAAIAGRAVTSGLPIALAALAVDLARWGIQQCVTSPNGWCKPGPTNPASGDTGFDGYPWSCNAGPVGGGTGYGDSPYAACAAASIPAYIKFTGISVDGTTMWAVGTRNDMPDHPQIAITNQIAHRDNTCVSGYVPSGGKCVPDPNANVQPVPVQYPELATDLANVLSGNPNRAKDYWGFMPWTDQLAALATLLRKRCPRKS